MKTLALSLITLVSAAAFAGEPLIAPKGKPAPVRDTATIACEEIYGANADVDLLDSCKASFADFQLQSRLLGVAEMAKKSIAGNPVVIDLMKQMGAGVIQQAKDAGQLVTQGAVEPDLAFDWGVGSIREDGGVVCAEALDYTQDDEFGTVIPGLYECRIRGGVYINYMNKNMCSEFPELKLEESEQWITFTIKEDGTVLKKSINTRALLTIQDNCAG